MKQFSKYDDEKRVHDLENVKLKLKMISKNSKSSKVSVDDYISNILGSGLNISKSVINKVESQSAQNIKSDRNSRSNGNDFNHSSINISSNYPAFSDSIIESDFLSNLPYFYQEIINTVKLQSGDLDTQKIYNIFLTSCLSTDILGTIWSMINRTLPGRLTVLELSVGLAMIAFYQKQSFANGTVVPFPSITWETIVSRGEFPIPNLSIDKPVKASNGIDLNNIYPVNPNKISSVTIIDKSANNENWADFTSFKSHDHEIAENKMNIPSQQISDVTNVNQPLDIQKQIFNQFSTWQNNIKSENNINASISLTSIENSNHLSTDKEEFSIELNDKITIETNNSIKCNFDSDFGEFQIFASDHQLNNSDKSESTNCQKILLTDKYQIFNSELIDPHNNLINQWLRCLNQCKKIIYDIVKVLDRIEDQSIKAEVFNANKGSLLLSGIIEVYRVTRNIKLSTSKTNILTSSQSLLDIFTDIEKYWNNFMILLPDELQIYVQTKLSKRAESSDCPSFSDDTTSNDICGVCLCLLDPGDGFLSHGLRRYHCPCANLWVNTLDLTLPGLSVPESVL